MSGYVTGPIAITGANGHVGRALQARLADAPNEVRALDRDDVEAAKFMDAEVVIHLAGTLRSSRSNSYLSANLETLRRTVAALDGSSVRRLLFLSYVGADPSSANDYLRTKGQAEQLVRSAAVPSVVIRSTFIYGPPEDPGPSAEPFIHEGTVSVIGTGRQRWAPVFVGDVVEALARLALAPDVLTGTFALAGPQELTVDEFVGMLNRGMVKERHIAGAMARTVAHLVPTLTPAMVEILSADSLADGRLLADVLDLELERVGRIYRPAWQAASIDTTTP